MLVSSGSQEELSDSQGSCPLPELLPQPQGRPRHYLGQVLRALEQPRVSDSRCNCGAEAQRGQAARLVSHGGSAI